MWQINFIDKLLDLALEFTCLKPTLEPLRAILYYLCEEEDLPTAMQHCVKVIRVGRIHGLYPVGTFSCDVSAQTKACCLVIWTCLSDPEILSILYDIFDDLQKGDIYRHYRLGIIASVPPTKELADIFGNNGSETRLAEMKERLQNILLLFSANLKLLDLAGQNGEFQVEAWGLCHYLNHLRGFKVPKSDVSVPKTGSLVIPNMTMTAPQKIVSNVPKTNSSLIVQQTAAVLGQINSSATNVNMVSYSNQNQFSEKKHSSPNNLPEIPFFPGNNSSGEHLRTITTTKSNDNIVDNWKKMMSQILQSDSPNVDMEADNDTDTRLKPTNMADNHWFGKNERKRENVPVDWFTDIVDKNKLSNKAERRIYESTFYDRSSESFEYQKRSQDKNNQNYFTENQNQSYKSDKPCGDINLTDELNLLSRHSSGIINYHADTYVEHISNKQNIITSRSSNFYANEYSRSIDKDYHSSEIIYNAKAPNVSVTSERIPLEKQYEKNLFELETNLPAYESRTHRKTDDYVRKNDSPTSIRSNDYDNRQTRRKRSVTNSNPPEVFDYSHGCWNSNDNKFDFSRGCWEAGNESTDDTDLSESEPDEGRTKAYSNQTPADQVIAPHVELTKQPVGLLSRGCWKDESKKIGVVYAESESNLTASESENSGFAVASASRSDTSELNPKQSVREAQLAIKKPAWLKNDPIIAKHDNSNFLTVGELKFTALSYNSSAPAYGDENPEHVLQHNKLSTQDKYFSSSWKKVEESNRPSTPYENEETVQKWYAEKIRSNRKTTEDVENKQFGKHETLRDKNMHISRGHASDSAKNKERNDLSYSSSKAAGNKELSNCNVRESSSNRSRSRDKTSTHIREKSKERLISLRKSSYDRSSSREKTSTHSRERSKERAASSKKSSYHRSHSKEKESTHRRVKSRERSREISSTAIKEEQTKTNERRRSSEEKSRSCKLRNDKRLSSKDKNASINVERSDERLKTIDVHSALDISSAQSKKEVKDSDFANPLKRKNSENLCDDKLKKSKSSGGKVVDETPGEKRLRKKLEERIEECKAKAKRIEQKLEEMDRQNLKRRARDNSASCSKRVSRSLSRSPSLELCQMLKQEKSLLKLADHSSVTSNTVKVVTSPNKSRPQKSDKSARSDSSAAVSACTDSALLKTTNLNSSISLNTSSRTISNNEVSDNKSKTNKVNGISPFMCKTENSNSQYANPTISGKIDVTNHQQLLGSTVALSMQNMSGSLNQNIIPVVSISVNSNHSSSMLSSVSRVLAELNGRQSSFDTEHLPEIVQTGETASCDPTTLQNPNRELPLQGVRVLSRLNERDVFNDSDNDTLFYITGIQSCELFINSIKKV